MKYLFVFLLLGLFFSCGTENSKESVKCDSKGKGDLGIYETIELAQIRDSWSAADELSRPEEGFEVDTINNSFDESFDEFMMEGYSLTSLVIPIYDGVIGYVKSDEDKSKVNKMLNRPDIKILFDSSLKFMWSAKKESIDYKSQKKGWYLYCCRIPENGKAKLNGSHISNVSTGYDAMNGDVTIDLMMTDEGASEWSKLTQENIMRILAIAVDDVVYSAPVVRSTINNGNTQISGNFTFDEAEKLACLLNKGS